MRVMRGGGAMRFAEEDVLAWLSIKIIEYGTKEDA